MQNVQYSVRGPGYLHCEVVVRDIEDINVFPCFQSNRGRRRRKKTTTTFICNEQEVVGMHKRQASTVFLINQSDMVIREEKVVCKPSAGEP